MRKKRAIRKKRHGRPTKLTAETQRRIVEAIQLGCTYNIAASYGGINEGTFYGWMNRGREAKTGIYKEFFQAVKQAESMNAVRNLAAIAQSAKDGNWTAAAWILERRHGYTKEPDRPLVDITLEMQNTEVLSLVEEIQQANLKELITGPVIDLDEE